MFDKFLKDILKLGCLMIALAIMLSHDVARAHDVLTDKMIQSYRDTVSMDQPARDTLWYCRADRTKKMSGFPYYDPTTGLADLSKKPVTTGHIAWPSDFSLSKNGDEYVLTGNGFPDTATGEFPNRYNPNPIREIKFSYRIQLKTVPEEKHCLPMGPIAVAMNGAMIFNALTLRNDDALITEVLDSCAGHPEHRGLYHHHGWSPCWDDKRETEPVGIAFDGFLIFGRKEKGVLVRNADLDECHGHSHKIKGRLLYHYHINQEFPYTLGCYQGASQVRP